MAQYGIKEGSMSDRGVEDVDLLVIGGGKAGKSLAMDRAKAGWKVAMVERDKIGGTCINVACIPTKALVGSARTVLMARHAEVMGVELGDQPLVSVDGLRRHKSSVVDGMVAAHKKMFADSGMDFILGTARFITPRTVEVETRDETIRLLRGTDVVINTGTTPAIPDLAGITESRVWTSETILQLERLPQRLIVLGGGYVGCEFASMFALFGTQVTLLQGPDQLLPREDFDVAAEVADILTNQGVGLRLGTRAQAVHREANNGDVVVVLEDGSQVGGEELLVATGRAPVTADLGLESAGVDLTDRGFISVDSQLRTTADHIWAAGDVAGSPQFTHASWNDFRILKANFDHGDAVTTGRIVPYTVFITPELARVGITEGPSPGPEPERGSRQDPGFGHSEGQDAPRRDGHMEGGRGRRHRPNPWCGTARPQRRRGHFHTTNGYARRTFVPAGARRCAHPSHHGGRPQPAL
jgi:pyruvate/2-oxoglutarate dehydrogenase complex dihydrolipoamide dehydrogenase (E3) component